MPSSFFAFAEMALVFGLVVGFCVWELWKLRQYKEQDKFESNEENKSSHSQRGLFGVRKAPANLNANSQSKID